ncbi:MAG: sugar transferase [bacterium]|nr:sugar transferase [bacterium]
MIRERINLILKLYSLIDVSVIALAFPLAYVLRSQFTPLTGIPSLMPLPEYLPLLGFILPIWMGLLFLNKAYSSHRGRSNLPLLWTVVKTNLEGVSVLSLLFFSLKLHMFNRSLVFLFVLVCTALLTAEKIALMKWLGYIRKQGKNLKRVLIVGTDSRVQVIIKRIEQHPETGFVITGLLSDHPDEIYRKAYGYNVLGSFQDLARVLHEEIIDEVICAIPIFALHKIRPSLEVCEQMGINCRIVLDTNSYSSNFKMFVDNILDLPLISFSYREKQFLSLGLKRLMDIVISASCLLALSPALAVIAGLIRWQSPGTALFRQVRSGLNGRRFVMYKFRTMVENAEALREKLLEENESSGPIFKMRHDPRITKIGGYLRRTSLDEIPQLWNVLKGEMSLVGPRPLPLVESEHIAGRERRRLSMKPGITGMWQCNGRSASNYEHLIDMDLDYVDNWSLLLDVKLLIKTIPVVIHCIGAM